MLNNNPLFWIIDEEWSDYDIETEIIKKYYPTASIKYSTYDYKDDLKKWGDKADIVLAQVYADIPGDVIRRLKNCRGIALFGGGYDRVDIEVAAEMRIPVTNVKNYCKEDIAEYVINAMLYSNKALDSFNTVVEENLWGLGAIKNLQNRLSEQKLFVIGLGRIGKFVGKTAQALGMKVYAYDPQYRSGEKEDNIEMVSLEEGLAIADFVTVHCNLSEKTKSMLGMPEFLKMKSTGILINTARGAILKENELLEAVERKIIGGAVLDVIEQEPPTKEYYEKFRNSDVIVTPHISYLSVQSIDELKHRSTKNGIAMLKGKLTDDVVNINDKGILYDKFENYAKK
ncbi:NAD(P)-dependent oxidoreductase [Liquorilactobacillus mali]|uniref:Glyoxylate reductase n=1 Tax=Liquorilactobacillus mali TaxID=1618 RepID=A0A0R2FE73_9LACO|nr:NAD(P)-dependent oxidoreductase [Liquorilactobacillus mali]KRN26494.1 glyoxylate reductase [Liquorilactobacillus mali]